jgi:hypothetical protein
MSLDVFRGELEAVVVEADFANRRHALVRHAVQRHLQQLAQHALSPPIRRHLRIAARVDELLLAPRGMDADRAAPLDLRVHNPKFSDRLHGPATFL